MARAIYFDCPTGISGDMALGSLLDLGLSLDALVAGLRGLALPLLHPRQLVEILEGQDDRDRQDDRQDQIALLGHVALASSAPAPADRRSALDAMRARRRHRIVAGAAPRMAT